MTYSICPAQMAHFKTRGDSRSLTTATAAHVHSIANRLMAGHPGCCNCFQQCGDRSCNSMAGSRTLDITGSVQLSCQKLSKKYLTWSLSTMSKLRGDIWVDNTTLSDHTQASRQATAKPPVTDIHKCMAGMVSRMAALLVTKFPQKASELWAYQ